MPRPAPVALALALFVCALGPARAQDGDAVFRKVVRRAMIELESEDWGTRLRAAESLADPRAVDAKAALLAALADPNRFDVHPAAVRALGAIGALTDVELAAIVRALADPDPLVAGSAARALAEQPSASVPAVAELATLAMRDFAAPPAPAADATGWAALVGRTYVHSWMSRRGDGTAHSIRFAEHDGVRFAWLLSSSYEVEPPPPPPFDGGPAVPGGGNAPDPPPGVPPVAAPDPGPAPPPFFWLDWDVRCSVVELAEEDGQIVVSWRDRGTDVSVRVAADWRSMEAPAGRSWGGARYFARDGREFAGEARELAVQTLTYVIPQDVPSAELGALLTSGHTGLAMRAAAALEGRPGATEFATELLRFSVTGQRGVKPRAREAFLTLPGEVAEVELRDALLSDDDGLRYGVLSDIRYFRPHTRLVAELLGKWYADGAPFENANVGYALGQLGPDALPALPSLLLVLERHDRPHGNALGIIGSIGPGATEALPAMLKIARGRPGFGHARLSAARAIARVAPDHAELPGFVVVCCADPNDNVAEHAMMWARSMNPVPDGVVDSVISLARRERWETRRSAADTLGVIGGDRADVREVLVALIDDSQAYVRVSAAASLARVSPGHYRPPRALVAAMDDENWSVRWHAAMALEQIGPAARSALPRLRRARDDADEHGHVRRSARNAIAAIEGD